MNNVSYADQKIGSREMVIIIANAVIGVGILTFPRSIADETDAFDGWISVLIAGAAACLIGWLLGRLASRFPNHTFFEYVALIAGRPFAYLLTLLFGVYSTLLASFEIRAVGNIAKQYLFTTTPVEMITLAFLLIVQYAAAGSRIALLRLNLLFLPIVLLVIFMVQVYTLRFLEWENVRPFFSTDWMSLLSGVKRLGLSMTGGELVLFYTILMKRPQDAPKSVTLGMAIPILLYMTIYMIVIGVFSSEVVRNLTFPTIELAKGVEVPGGFIERVESVFFTIWIMTIFNTCSISFDLAITTLQSVFTRISRFTWILILSPIIYLIAMMPQNQTEFFTFGDRLGYFGVVIAYVIPLVLLAIAKLRGVKDGS
jgi:spore germination protein